MLKWVRVPLSEGTVRFTEKEFILFDGMHPLMTFGLKRETLITREYYVWITPTKYLKARHIRPIKKALSLFDGCILMANVLCADEMSCKFAKILGFTPRKINDETLCYERDA